MYIDYWSVIIIMFQNISHLRLNNRRCGSMKKSKLFLIASTVALLSQGNVLAADGIYELNPVVVTAERKEKIDLETPSTVKIITQKEIQNKGYQSVFAALENSIGISSFSYGPDGRDGGGHISRVLVRGMDKGTLVLVNGAPVNIMNYASTSGIPVEAVEKIEIIKGANSTLYGAEAMSGVVNIITKHSGDSHFTTKTGYGNYRQNFAVGATGDKYNIWVQRDFYDAIDQTSRIFPKKSTYQAENKGYKTSWYMSGNLTDKLTLDWSRVDNHQNIWYMVKDKGGKALGIPPAKSSISDYHSIKDNVNLIYNDTNSGYRAILAYNSRKLDGKKVTYGPKGKTTTKRVNVPYQVRGITFDNQKIWTFDEGRNTVIGGVTYKGEHYNRLDDKNKKVYRDSYSAYLSYGHEYNRQFSTILGMRMEAYQANGWDDKHNVFLPQLQFLYKVNSTWSLYGNIGKSFDMPAINSKYYSNGVANWGLKPQEGWTYEIGSKYISGKNRFKTAIFHMRIKDKFEWVKENTVRPGGDPDKSIQINGGDFRNSGIEVEYTHVINENWMYNAGITLQNPKINGSGRWVRDAAGLQYNLGFQYTRPKWTAGVDLFVTGNREDAYYTNLGEYASKKGADHRVPDRIMLNSTVQYRPTKGQAFTLNMYNLLDRTNCTNKYENWDLPFNWTLSYQYKF